MDSLNSKALESAHPHISVRTAAMCVFIITWSAFFLSAFADRNVLTSWIFKGSMGYDCFMDFFNCVHDAAMRGFDGAYNSIYLPIVNIGYTLLAALAPSSSLSDEYGYGAAFRASIDGRVEFAICMLLTIVLLAIVVKRLLDSNIAEADSQSFGMCLGTNSANQANTAKTTKAVKTTSIARITYTAEAAKTTNIAMVLNNAEALTGIIVSLFVVTSIPVLYAIERGNNVLLALLLLLVFFLWKDSESPFQRQLAIASLALSVCMKIYPVLFGFVLLKERRWREIGLAALFTGVFAIVPFFAYDGVGTVHELYENLTGSITYLQVWGYGFRCGMTNTITIICALLNGGSFGLPSAAKAIVTFALILSVALALRFEASWKSTTLIGLVVVLLPTLSYLYNIVFLLPGFLLFLRQAGDLRSGKNALYLAMFMICFMPVPFGQADCLVALDGIWRVSTYCLVSSITLMLFWMILCAEGLIALSSALSREIECRSRL